MRPLIIKINNHKVESNSKAIGSIDLNLIAPTKAENLISDEETIPNDDDIKNNGEVASSSLVRNLISRYEDPKTKNLMKFKSKSMIDLQKPKVPLTPTSQDDHLYNRSQYDKEEKFDFKKVLNMFQSIDKSVPVNNTSSKPSKMFNYTKKEDTKLEDFDIKLIKGKAIMLLYDKPNLDSSDWQNQVLELLEQISGVQPSNYTNDSFNRIEIKRQLRDGKITNLNYGEDSGIDETDLKESGIVKEPIRLKSSVKDIKKYFESDWTKRYIPYEEYIIKQEVEESEELDYSSDSTESFNTVQTASPTNFSNVIFAENNQMHAFDLDNLKSLVDDLINEVHYYEEIINHITRDDTKEFAEMNDALYNILLKLENIRAYGDEELLNKRKDAIQFVQTCTAKLKLKIKD